MMQFVDRITEVMGKPPRTRLNPDEVVALGAAVQAGLIAQDASVEELVITDVAPFTLGVEISKQFGSEHRNGYFLPVIHRNTTIPASRQERVVTLQAHQSQIIVMQRIFEGRRPPRRGTTSFLSRVRRTAACSPGTPAGPGKSTFDSPTI